MYQFVGQSVRGRKAKWPLRLQALVIAANLNENLGGAEAFRVALERYNATAATAFPPLPPSYSGKNAGSLLYGLKKRFLARLSVGDVEAQSLVQELSINVQSVE